MAFSLVNKKPKFKVSTELECEVQSHLLKVVGEIPSWISGTLIRNGPIKVTIDGKSNGHWFDGLAMLHAFSFQGNEVSYTNRFLRSSAYKTVFEHGSLSYDGFASDPCRSLFKRFFTFFIPNNEKIPNANVNVTKLADKWVALTEIPLPVLFDPDTLETLGVFNFQDELPKKRCWESAHPHYDPHTNQIYNYLIKYGKKSTYTIYSIDKGSSERKILASIPVDEPSYMHSFAITKNYLILTEFPFVVRPLDLILKGKAFIKNFEWQPERGTRFIVIDRHTGKQVGCYVTEPFFAFHHANAFEDENVLKLDIVTYSDASIITTIDLNCVTAQNYPSTLKRYSLDLKAGKIHSERILSSSCEFPGINEKHDGQKYRFVYLAGFKDKDLVNAECLYKVNTETKECLKWQENGSFPGEPVFLPSPQAKAEDGGVLLTVVMDDKAKCSFLLILNAKNFKEVARVNAPHLIPQGFHGKFFSDDG